MWRRHRLRSMRLLLHLSFEPWQCLANQLCVASMAHMGNLKICMSTNFIVVQLVKWISQDQ